jgi:hypothetical protein
MADLAGLTIAYDAYRMSLNGKEAPVIDGYTGDQRFSSASDRSGAASIATIIFARSSPPIRIRRTFTVPTSSGILILGTRLRREGRRHLPPTRTAHQNLVSWSYCRSGPARIGRPRFVVSDLGRGSLNKRILFASVATLVAAAAIIGPALVTSGEDPGPQTTADRSKAEIAKPSLRSLAPSTIAASTSGCSG